MEAAFWPCTANGLVPIPAPLPPRRRSSPRAAPQWWRRAATAAGEAAPGAGPVPAAHVAPPHFPSTSFDTAIPHPNLLAPACPAFHCPTCPLPFVLIFASRRRCTAPCFHAFPRISARIYCTPSTPSPPLLTCCCPCTGVRSCLPLVVKQCHQSPCRRPLPPPAAGSLQCLSFAGNSF